MKQVLVTGVNGFVGHHLARELSVQDVQVLGVSREDTLSSQLKSVVSKYINCDLADKDSVSTLPLGSIDAVINLAGLAQVGASFGQEKLYNDINVRVHTNLVEHLKKLGKTNVRVVAVSTGAVYRSDQPLPLNENSALISEGSPYALSKIAMEKALQSYVRDGMDVVIVRPFNHIGPGQGAGFLLPDLFDQIQSYKKANQPITAGNLKTKRDYTDVRDVVKAYALLALADELHERVYNVCTGTSHSGEEILNLLVKHVGLENSPEIKVDQAKIRSSDAGDIYGNHELLTRDTGWQPTIPIEQTIADFVADR